MTKNNDQQPAASKKPKNQRWPYRKRYLPSGREEIFMHPDISQGRVGLSPLRLGEQRRDASDGEEQ
ncbi:hypothetical protein [uncultured Tessaracoccus sp.]|uniref:hypothetical protein n=1 Tax=uncultured Tessaracoccus sp. TaxID=905023 RepID=UPI00262F6FF3|nr:hypothetical protein [uncultured Tessaracoccus sp.]